MRIRMKQILPLLVGFSYLTALLTQATAEPLTLKGPRPSAVASLESRPNSCQLPPDFTRLLAALKERAAEKGSLVQQPISSLPRQGNRLAPPSRPDLGPRAKPPANVSSFGRLSLAFIENKGQVDEAAKFYLKTSGQTLWLTSEGIVFDLLRPLSSPISSPNSSVPASPPPLRGRIKEGDDESYRQAERLIFAQDLVGANKNPAIEARNPQPGTYNYFIGNDEAKWRTGVRAYAEVIYRDVWNEIDLKLYGNGRNLEQEFIVRPGADLSQIQIAYRGIEGLRVAQDGSLLIKTAFGDLKESKPRIYQEINGRNVEVAGSFKLLSETSYTFEVGPYQEQYALVIDPTLVWSTYLGGSTEDYSASIAVDGAGNAYVTGHTRSVDFPTAVPFQGAQPAQPGSESAFVTKLNSTGSALVYSTYLGGSTVVFQGTAGTAIAVDGTGAAYVTGWTGTSDFPTTPGAFDTTPNWGSAFVTKLSPTGSSLVYSTLLGGIGGHGTKGFAIAVDPDGNAYVAGDTDSAGFPTLPGFPTTLGAFDTTYNGGFGGTAGDAFVTKLNAAGSALLYSTFLGGTDQDTATDIKVDAAGNAYVIGWTSSRDFPTTAGAFQAAPPPISPGAPHEAFVTKLNPSGSALVYSTYLAGTGNEIATGIAVDAAGAAYVTGWTSSIDFPTTSAAFDTTLNGSGGWRDAFVTQLRPDGSGLVYSTFLGGDSLEAGFGIALDSVGNAIVVGSTASTDFPATPDGFQRTLASSSPTVGTGFENTHEVAGDVFLTKLNAAGSTLTYSIYLGGTIRQSGRAIALDAIGDTYITGWTASFDFLIATPGGFFQPFQNVYAGGNDAFVAKFSTGTPTVFALSSILPSTGGDTGSVSAIIHGSGFVDGAAVRLVRSGQADIVGDPVSVAEDGRTVATTFDLVGKARGVWDAVVTNPDGTSVTLEGAFTIEEGRAPQVWVDIIGRDTIMVGREQTFYILVGNRGNVDAVGILIIRGIPTDATWKLGLAPPLLDGVIINWDEIPIQVETDEEIAIPLPFTTVSPGITETTKIGITIPTLQTFELRAQWLGS